MSLLRPTKQELSDARDKFAALILRNAPEPDFQQLFAKNPFILSSSLPLRLEPADILPQGNPGKAESDFLIYPEPQDGRPLLYGAIELKRPSTPILGRPRKDLLVLSRDATTALKQAEKFARKLQRKILMHPNRVFAVGSEKHLFLVVGLHGELKRKVDSEELFEQMEGLLPPLCKLIPYDTLLASFERSIPKTVYVITPELPPTPEPLHIGPEFWAYADSLVEDAVRTGKRVGAVCIKVVSASTWGWGREHVPKDISLAAIGARLVSKLKKVTGTPNAAATATDLGFVSIMPIGQMGLQDIRDELFELMGDHEVKAGSQSSADVSFMLGDSLAHAFVGLSVAPDEASEAGRLVEVAVKRAWSFLPGAWEELIKH